MLTEIVLLAFSAIFIHEVVLTHIFKIRSAQAEPNLPFISLISATIFSASLANWALNTTILKPLNLEYLRIITCITVIFAVAQIIRLISRKIMNDTSKIYAQFAPLMVFHFAVFGISLLVTHSAIQFIDALKLSVTSAIVFAVIAVLFGEIRERLAFADIPSPFNGTAIHMICAGLGALAFMGFAGLI